MSEIVTDEEVERALDYLRDQSVTAAKALAEAAYMSEYRKTLKAKLMGECNARTNAEQQRYAYAHPDYEAHLRLMQTAIEKAKAEEFRMSAARTKVDVWKADQFRIRAMERLT